MSDYRCPRGLDESSCPEVIDYVADLLAMRKRKSQIKARLQEVLGDNVALTPPAMEWLLTQARKVIHASGDKNRQEFRQDSIDFLQSIIASDDASYNVKLRAQEQLSNIVGIGGQFTAQDTGDSAEDLAEKARQALAAMDDNVDPEV